MPLKAAVTWIQHDTTVINCFFGFMLAHARVSEGDKETPTTLLNGTGVLESHNTI